MPRQRWFESPSERYEFERRVYTSVLLSEPAMFSVDCLILKAAGGR